MKRIGIVGVGGFASSILRSVRLVESEGLAALDAVVVRNPAKHPQVVQRLKEEGRPIFSSMSEMIEQAGDKLDIIALPVGIPSHSPLAIQAMEAGFDVVMEKPIAATVQEVDAMVETSRRTAKFCAVGFQHIHTPAIKMLRDEIEAGRLGKIKRAKSYGLWPRGTFYYQRNVWAGQIWAEGNWVLDGPITNACAHFSNNMLYLAAVQAGGKVAIEHLQGELYRARDLPTYDTGCLRIATNTGTEILFYLTHAVDKLTNPIIEIEAEHAHVTWTYDGAKAVVRYGDGVIKTVEGEGNDSHAQVFRDAIAVAEGKTDRPLFAVADGRNQVLAVNLLFESSAGIRTIPGDACVVVKRPNADQFVQVKGMAEAVERAFAGNKLLSEIGAPWATPGTRVAGAGYVEFPQSQAVRDFVMPYVGKTRDFDQPTGSFEWSSVV